MTSDKFRMRQFITATVLLLVFFVTNKHFTQAKYVGGRLIEPSKWHFLARFCFLSRLGKLEYRFRYPKNYGVQRIGLYYDSKDQWPAVYPKEGMSCEKRQAALNYLNFQFINLTVDDIYAGCDEVNTTEGLIYMDCEGGRSFKSSRERWWFVAIMNCDAVNGLYLDYDLQMTNGPRTSFFTHHFSADEFHILETDIAFMIIFVVMLSLAAFVAHRLRERALFHSTYKLFMASLWLELIGLISLCIAYGEYANDGVGMPSAKRFGDFCEACSLLIFQLLLILVAKGYTVTRGRLRQATVVKITVFFTLYIVTYCVLFVYDAEFMDPGQVLYVYESPAGYGLVALRLIGWVWFTYAIIFTIHHYPEKQTFYYWFFFFYSLWFFMGPVTVLIATKKISKWAREKSVNGVELAVSFAGHAFFLILTRPTAANKNFPYHVRTSQIGVASPQGGAGGGAGGGGGGEEEGEQNFVHHRYAVTSPGETQLAPTHGDIRRVNGHSNGNRDLFTISYSNGEPKDDDGGTVQVQRPGDPPPSYPGY